MAKRSSGERRGAQTVYSEIVVPDSRPTGNAFRLRGRPSWFDSNSPTYTKQAPICSVVGKGERCPVQQFFSDGHAKLRFCEDVGKKGRVIDVGDDFEAANAKAQKLCKCWKESSPDPRKRSFAGCPDLADAPLGGVRTKTRSKKRRKR